MDKGEVIVSFDVSSLFTYVSIGEEVYIIRARLEKDAGLEQRNPLSPGRGAELLQLCLWSTYFSFSGEFYGQNELRGSHSSPVSAVVTNLYMEFFEGLALNTMSRIWKCYVDDTFKHNEKR